MLDSVRVGDKFVCIQRCEIWISEKSKNYKYDSDISKIGELVEFIGWKDLYRYRMYDKYPQRSDFIIVLINGDEYAIYKDYFLKSFITITDWRQQQIDKIEN
jgi:hypothetical protein